MKIWKSDEELFALAKQELFTAKRSSSKFAALRGSAAVMWEKAAPFPEWVILFGLCPLWVI
jgi:hypothetical protein